MAWLDELQTLLAEARYGEGHELLRATWRRAHRERNTPDCANFLPPRTREQFTQVLESTYSSCSDTKRKRCMSSLKYLEQSAFWHLSRLDAFALLGMRILHNREFLDHLRSLEATARSMEPARHREDVLRALEQVSADRKAGRKAKGFGRTVSRHNEWAPADIPAAKMLLKGEYVLVGEEGSDEESMFSQGEDDTAEASTSGRKQNLTTRPRPRVLTRSQAQETQQAEESEGDEIVCILAGAADGRPSPEPEPERGRRRESPIPDHMSELDFHQPSHLDDGNYNNTQLTIEYTQYERAQLSPELYLVDTPHATDIDFDFSLPPPSHESSIPFLSQQSNLRKSQQQSPSDPTHLYESISRRLRSPSTMPSKRPAPALNDGTVAASRQRHFKRQRKSLVTHAADAAESSADVVRDGMIAWSQVLRAACSNENVTVEVGTTAKLWEKVTERLADDESTTSFCALIKPAEEEDAMHSGWQLIFIDSAGRVSHYWPLRQGREDSQGERLVKRFNALGGRRIETSDLVRIDTVALPRFDSVSKDSADTEDVEASKDLSHLLVAAAASYLCQDHDVPRGFTPELWNYILSSCTDSSASDADATTSKVCDFGIVTVQEFEARAKDEAEADFIPRKTDTELMLTLAKPMDVVAQVLCCYEDILYEVTELNKEAQTARKLVSTCSRARSSSAPSNPKDVQALEKEVHSLEDAFSALEAANLFTATSRDETVTRLNKKKHELATLKARKAPEGINFVVHLLRQLDRIIGDLGDRRDEYWRAKQRLRRRVEELQKGMMVVTEETKGQ